MSQIINFLEKSKYINRPLFLRVQFYRILFVFLGITLALAAQAQDDEAPRRRGSRIIDDSTRQIYGPRTSRYFFERDVFYNRHYYYPIDTAIHNYHRFNYVQSNNNLYQDLGNIGTSIRPIYYQAPELIGVTSGFNSFDLYWDTEKIKYYDTKSPYSNLKIILGGLGRSITRVSFSRNITPQWNFGFNFRSLLIDKQINRTGKGDRNVKSTYYDIYTAYQTKDSTYRLFFNFRRNHYQADENGGLKPNQGNYYDKLAAVWLDNAESRERRNNIHLFHQYQVLGKGFQIYHEFDGYNQHNNFYDNWNTTLNSTYFDWIEDVDPDTTKIKDGAVFKTIRNEAGIKGNLAKLFYNGYYAIRHYDMTYKYYDEEDVRVQTRGNEHYVGGRMALTLDSIGEVNAWAEFETLGNFRIQGDIKSKWFEASLKQLLIAPSFLQQAYRGRHDVWNNNFTSTKTTQINGYLHYNSRIFKLSPGLTFTRLNDYVYFNYNANTGEPQKVLPVQSSGTQVIASPEVKLSLTMLRHLTLSGQAIYTKILQNDDRAISVPELFLNGQLSYANIFFNGNMDMQGGVDVHWKSTYNAFGYDPVIQQFYRQDFLYPPTASFPIIDVFFNMKVKSGRIFVKYNNVMQAFTKSGYMPTPYYPGQRNSIDFGFDLLFYD
jgi:hypothetical protein